MHSFKIGTVAAPTAFTFDTVQTDRERGIVLDAGTFETVELSLVGPEGEASVELTVSEVSELIDACVRVLTHVYGYRLGAHR